MKKLALLHGLLLCAAVNAAEIQHNFNSPSFSGLGFSSHVLTIKQLEDQQRDKNKSAADALKAQADSAAANSPQARFLANLESRIYSQLAMQLTNSMFGEGQTCASSVQCGLIPDLGGNTVSWRLGDAGIAKEQGMIIITIVNNSNPSQTTTMMVPSGTFYF